MLTRRDFAAGTSAAFGAILLGGSTNAKEKELTEKRLILLGINGLARAAEMNYFADGHRAASMISAHMMCVDNNLGDEAARRIVELFDLNWARQKLCDTFPDSETIPDATEKIGKALADGGGVLREVGHDAIFAMHAMKAFRMMPETATTERVDGVCKLIGSFKPWRDMDPDDSVNPPSFKDERVASRFILKEASNAIDRFAGFGQGFAGHMLTFGQSLVEMATTGDEEWAESCRVAFRKYVTVTRLGPRAGDRKIRDHKITELRPRDAQYWNKRGDKTLGLGHVFKYPYAYYDLLARADDPELERELEQKIWQLF